MTVALSGRKAQSYGRLASVGGIPQSCRADQKERARRANKRVGLGRDLVALQPLNDLLQLIIQALLLPLRQFDLEGLARTHVVEMQFDVLAWMVLARGMRVEQFSCALCR